MDKKIKQLTCVANYMRHRHGLSIAQLSAQTGVSAMTISRIENGCPTTDISGAIRLAEFFDISVDALLRNNFSEIFPKLSTLTAPIHEMYDRMAQISIICQKNGLRGEDWVYLQECKRLSGTVMAHATNPNYADDDEAHFDILTFDHTGRPIVVEVKSTTRGPNEPFVLTAAELQTARDCHAEGIRYEIHRVYYVQNARKIDRYIITCEELLSNYDFIPKRFLVKKKEVA